MFSYLGGKKFQAKWISNYFPKHDTYVEPFGGAFWVYFVGNINANKNVYGASVDVVMSDLNLRTISW